MKKISILFLIICVSLITGCSTRDEKYPNALRIGVEDVPKTLNPYASSDTTNLFVTSHIYNALLGSHVTPLDYVEGKDYYFEDGTKYEPADETENYYLFEDGLVKYSGAYPKKDGSKYGFEYFQPTADEYDKQLEKKNIVFGYDELGIPNNETNEEFLVRREEAVPSSDWIRYRFEVDTRYTWNDGEEFSASDIEFTFKYILKYAGQLGSVAYFLDNYFYCEADNGDFVLELASNKLSDIKTICNSIIIVPKHVWDKIGDPDSFSNLDNPVGTNAYKLVEDGFITDASVCLEYRDDFNSGLKDEMFAYDAIENIFLTKMSSEDVMLNALNRGDIDTTLNSFTVTKANSLKNNSSFSNLIISEAASSFVTTLVMNVGTNGIFKDLPIEVREAISLSIDQQALIDSYLYGDGKKVGSGLVTEGNIHSLVDDNGDYVYHVKDIDKANEILDTLYPKNSNGVRDLTLKILAPQTSEVLVNEISSQLNKNLGINVSFELADSNYSEYIKQRNNPSFDMIINTVTLDIDKILMFDARFGVYSSGAPRVWNLSGINDPELSSLMNSMDTAKTINEQLYYCTLVQQKIADSYVEVPLYGGMVYSIYQESKFTGWVPTKGGSVLSGTSLRYLQLNK